MNGNYTISSDSKKGWAYYSNCDNSDENTIKSTIQTYMESKGLDLHTEQIANSNDLKKIIEALRTMDDQGKINQIKTILGV